MLHTTNVLPAQGEIAAIAAENDTAALLDRVGFGQERGVFAEWQPRFAAMGIPTFPIEIVPDGKGGFRKMPLIQGWNRIRAPGSRSLVGRFGHVSALAFMCPLAGVSIIDIDTTDLGVLRAAIDRHGDTPLKVRTARGRWHLFYQAQGEPHVTDKPEGEDWPVDQITTGMIVAPPSRSPAGTYEFAEGSLDDLQNLPFMANPYASRRPVSPVLDTLDGKRNRTLYDYAMRQAPSCDTFDALLEVARDRNGEFFEPLDDDEVMKVAKSAWGYEERGENYARGRCAIINERTADRLVNESDAFALLGWLQTKNTPESRFWIANGLLETKTFNRWSLARLQKARRVLEDEGFIVQTTKAKPGQPAVFKWGPTRLKGRI